MQAEECKLRTASRHHGRSGLLSRNGSRCTGITVASRFLVSRVTQVHFGQLASWPWPDLKCGEIRKTKAASKSTNQLIVSDTVLRYRNCVTDFKVSDAFGRSTSFPRFYDLFYGLPLGDFRRVTPGSFQCSFKLFEFQNETIRKRCLNFMLETLT